MGTRDAKTVLKTPAVKRRSENIADLPTGPAKAVKRKATAKPFRDVVKWVNRLHVVRRAGLLNARGNKESGWVVREEEGEVVFHVAPAEESLLEALSRAVGRPRDHYFDVMQHGAGRACLVLHDTNAATGSGELLDGDAEEIASIHVARKLSAQCTVGGNPTPLVVLEPVRHGVHAMGGGKLLATVTPVSSGTFIQKVDRYEVAFQNGPRADHRLMVVAALILGDAWALMDVQRERRTRHSNAPALIDLLEAFDPD